MQKKLILWLCTSTRGVRCKSWEKLVLISLTDGSEGTGRIPTYKAIYQTMRQFMQRKIMSQLEQSTKRKRISVKHFFSNEIIKKKSNSHIPIDEAYMHRRLPEVRLSPPNLVSLQNAWFPLEEFSGQLQPLFVFSMTIMCKISCFR